MRFTLPWRPPPKAGAEVLEYRIMETETVEIAVPEELRVLAADFEKAGEEFYLVGGYVRDLLLGGAGIDVDAATGARPQKIKQLLGGRAEYLWTVGEKFGTIGARIGGYDVEVTTYRADLYTRGSRHPQVSFGDSLKEDLARRDFTVNAIAADAATGEISDPFEGRADLRRGIIRAVGDPRERMADDPLRMLRAVRFEVQLSTAEKPFAMDAALEESIKENAGWLQRISPERIRGEFDRILVCREVDRGLRALVRLGLMPYIVPEFMETVEVEQDPEFHHKDVFEHTLLVVAGVEAAGVLRRAAFFHDIGKPRTLVYEHRCSYCDAKSIRKTKEEGECSECGGRTVARKIHFYGHENVGAKIARRAMERLAYSRDEIDAVSHLVAHHMRPMSYATSAWSDSAVRRFIRDTYLARGDRVLADVDTLLKLAAADITGSAPGRRKKAQASWRQLRQRVDAVREVDEIEKLKSPLSGDDLMEHFGRGPGAWIKPLKSYLEAEVVEGRLDQNDRERAWKLVEDYVAAYGLAD